MAKRDDDTLSVRLRSLPPVQAPKPRAWWDPAENAAVFLIAVAATAILVALFHHHGAAANALQHLP